MSDPKGIFGNRMPEPGLFRLDVRWLPGGDVGRFAFELRNLGEVGLSGFQLAFTTLRFVAGEAAADNARLLNREGYFHEVAPADDFELAPGAVWRFSLGGLTGAPMHRGEGIASAYLTDADGRRQAVALGDLRRDGVESAPQPLKAAATYAMTPWPAEVELTPSDRPLGYLVPDDGCSIDDFRAVVAVASLFGRLFPTEPSPLSLIALAGDRHITFVADATLGASAYRLEFGEDRLTLVHGDVDGRRYGLTTLGQLMRGARLDGRCRFPAGGEISDQPRFAWRGCHLDTARRFFPLADLARFLDLLANFKLNVFHWHLSDDEAWRLEISGYQELTAIGARRGPDAALPPQLGDDQHPSDGHYSHADVRALVAHAAGLGINILPEIDIPGHSTAALAALPALADPDEPAGAYASVQGFANNALNPAVDLTWTMLGAVFDDLAALFPSRLVHIGGDEVAPGTWMASPLARALMADLGIDGTEALQSHFLRRVQAMLRERGRELAGWNEVGHGDGVDRAGTQLTVWQKASIGAGLAAGGYDIVMAPAEAYYLDMAEGDGWHDIGMSWAGSTSLKAAYDYEVAADISRQLMPKLKGVQACIWTELISSRDHFNSLVPPRLAAMAEAAWTPPEAKDWQRFSTLSALGPSL